MSSKAHEVVINFNNQTIIIRTKMFGNYSRFIAAHDTNKSKHAFLMCDDSTVPLCDLHLKMIDKLNKTDELVSI